MNREVIPDRHRAVSEAASTYRRVLLMALRIAFSQALLPYPGVPLFHRRQRYRELFSTDDEVVAKGGSDLGNET